MPDMLSQYREAIRATGLEPPEVIVAGKLHRFPGVGKRPSNRAGWCKLFVDGRGGCFGDWSSGITKHWQAEQEGFSSESERVKFMQQVEETRRQAAKDREAGQTNAAQKALTIWNVATQSTNGHPYLLRKDIKANGARLYNGALVLPVVDFNGKLTSLQFIQKDGSKRLLSNGRKQDCFIHVAGQMDEVSRVIICEGWATGCTLAAEEPASLVLAAIDVGNLEPVAVAARERWPYAELIIAGDDDRLTDGNPGATKARAAANAANALLALPQWPSNAPDNLTDFNDLSCWLKKNGDASTKLLYSVAQPDENWPELVPLDTPNLPRLDLKHIPCWAGEFSRALSEETETPPELAVGMVLVSCAAAIAPHVRVKVRQDYSEPCNLWVLVALPSGNRKSAVQAAATAPLMDWEHDQAKIMDSEIKRITSERKTMEARAKEARNKSAKEKDEEKSDEFAKLAADIEANLPEIPLPPQIWTSDATPERLGSLLAEHGECMAWLSSEGGVFDLLQGRYSNGIPNLDLVLKAHSGDMERVDRGSRPPVFLRSPRLSIGLSPQPDVLRGLAAKPGFRGRGLLARFLYLLPPSPLGYRKLDCPPMAKYVRDDYSAGIRAMLEWEATTDDNDNECPHMLNMSKEAYDVWLTYAQAIETEMQPGRDMEYFTDWAGKAPGAAARLAGVLHCIKHAHGRPWEMKISTETMFAVVEVMKIFTSHSLAAMNTMGADPTLAAAQHLWDWIERGRRLSFSARDAFNALRGSFHRMKNIRDALEALEERGYLQVIESKREGPGRPASPTVLVRQEFQDKWR